jgi:diaminohydroxyphosphoribosylaminopyrimidine deaminase/5-amino-6-(5-phosphoribosylamino)uracil reductase
MHRKNKHSFGYMNVDEKYMARCLQLAENGRQNAAPNPMVGAVIVCGQRIIGEGYHVRCGEAHAEVNAVASVKDEDKKLLKESTIYVSLEPCAHYGKTPPCAELIVKTGFKRVVVGCVDPFSKVQGKGISIIRNAGIDVTVGVLEKECIELNKRFITFHSQKRPFVTLKWAQTADGFIDTLTADDRLIISNQYTQTICHKRRTEHQAIMVGRRTAELDNPSLTARMWRGNNPLRIVLDMHGKLHHSLKLFDGSVPTWVYTDSECDVHDNIQGVEVHRVDSSKEVIPQILDDLYANGVQTLLVEGGRQLLQTFIDSRLWDETYVEIANMTIKDGVPAPELKDCVQAETLELQDRSIVRYLSIK